MASVLSAADARPRRLIQEDSDGSSPDGGSATAPSAMVASSLGHDLMRYSGLGLADKGHGPLIFIGVLTDFPEPGDCDVSAAAGTGTSSNSSSTSSSASASASSASSLHAQHRSVARASWLPDASSLPRVAVRFVTREPYGPVGRSQLAAELRDHGDVWVLPAAGDVEGEVAASEMRRSRHRRGGSRALVGGAAAAAAAAQEAVRCAAGDVPLTGSGGVMVPELMRRFLARVVRKHPSVEYIVHMDDSSLLLPQRLMCAADQWAAIGADYIGCMVYDKVPQDDPLSYFLSNNYPLHAAAGGPVALSAKAVRDVVVLGYDTLRLEGRTDVALGLWMLTTNVTYMDDRRLCQAATNNRCGPAAVGLYNSAARGGGGGLAPEQMLSAYGSKSRRTPPQRPLPYLRSRIKPVEDYMAALRL
ncbi:hypothetical protein PLESTB_000189100 [Pleodorina starrii]|uniref:Hexosyltransferase n=1 Tax=Pleodorina starrii TaxID=330485 RepID=A0A9W6BBM1_9CHLO|nr:hypothetical protein PLESTB_000189100 [Pleodorina starrii]